MVTSEVILLVARRLGDRGVIYGIVNTEALAIYIGLTLNAGHRLSNHVWWTDKIRRLGPESPGRWFEEDLHRYPANAWRYVILERLPRNATMEMALACEEAHMHSYPERFGYQLYNERHTKRLCP